ncbi:MAG: energy transducer TonB [Bacteroidetes bacterium]|nr:energy transducer TonB [Bacteroidota bacterium]
MTNDKGYTTKMLAALLMIILMMIFLLNRSIHTKSLYNFEPSPKPYIEPLFPPISVASQKTPETIEPKPQEKKRQVETTPLQVVTETIIDNEVFNQTNENDMSSVNKQDSSNLSLTSENTDNELPTTIEATNTSNNILSWSEQMPEYPGGVKALYEFIAKHLQYPSYEQEVGLEGMVVVCFVVSLDGSIEQIEILKSPSSGFSKAARNVIGSMSKWTPGQHNGQTVAVKYQLPIRFKIG